MRTSTAQRAHANFTENLTPFLGQLLLAGVRFPLLSAGLGAAWVVTRFMYAQGYATKGAKARAP